MKRRTPLGLIRQEPDILKQIHLACHSAVLSPLVEMAGKYRHPLCGSNVPDDMLSPEVKKAWDDSNAARLCVELLRVVRESDVTAIEDLLKFLRNGGETQGDRERTVLLYYKLCVSMGCEHLPMKKIAWMHGLKEDAASIAFLQEIARDLDIPYEKQPGGRPRKTPINKTRKKA